MDEFGRMKKIFAGKVKSRIFALAFRGVAQLASALAWGARGRKFESSRPDRVEKIERSWLNKTRTFFCKLFL